jgi:hypothetical protein
MYEVTAIVLVATAVLCACASLFLVLRIPISATALHSETLDRICTTIDHQASTIAKMAEELNKANDKTLAAADHLAYQTVKSFENHQVEKPMRTTRVTL